jgi:putative spermidine/putrescine transport system permease protein
MRNVHQSIGLLIGSSIIKLYAYMVLGFLIIPVVIIIPLSFNAEPFFTFTAGMLQLDPAAYSLRWYESVFTDSNWRLSFKNSFIIGLSAATIATILGTVAAVGLSSPFMPYKRLITSLLLSPMIVPLIIIAAGSFFYFSSINLASSYAGVIIAHSILGIPFVIITVTATLGNYDKSIYNAAVILGASPTRAFWDVVVPIIRPGVISGALFAFITSFDEVVVILFLGGPEHRTIPRQMFSGLREQINPSILAVATILIILSVLLLLTIEILRKRSEKMRTSRI